jgi:ankyrin repeat protein
MDNQAIQLAAAQGHTDVVTLLLQRSDVNPGAADNEAIRVATAHDVVTALLARPEVNPAAADNEAVRAASWGKDHQVSHH